MPTKRLLPILDKTLQQPSADVRIESLGSAGFRFAPEVGIDFSATTTPRADYDSFARYGPSKAANIIYASELGRRYPSLTSVSCHPGVINTELSTAYRTGNGMRGFFFGLVLLAIGKSVSEGAKNQLWCATGKDVVSGWFSFPVGAVHVRRGFPVDNALEGQLWEWTENDLSEEGVCLRLLTSSHRNHARYGIILKRKCPRLWCDCDGWEWTTLCCLVPFQFSICKASNGREGLIDLGQSLPKRGTALTVSHNVFIRS